MGLIVAGATGFVGRNLTHRAVASGEKVLCIVRSVARAAPLNASASVAFQQLDAEVIREAGFQGCSLVHLAGASRDEEDSSIRDAVVSTTALVVATAIEAESPRIVYLSGYGITAASTDPYFRCKAEAETLIANSGVRYTIFRTSYVLGPGDELTPYLINGLMRGRLRLPGSGRYKIQPIWIDDLAEILLRASADASGESRVIPLLGGAVSVLDLAKALAAKLAPGATIESVKVEKFLKEYLYSSDPDFTAGELALLMSSVLGPPTPSCYGVTLRGWGEIVGKLVIHHALNARD